MTADWERERAEQAEEVATLLAGVADGTIDAYEGAFAAGRILQNGGRLLQAERSRRYLDNEPVDDLPAERDDPRRSILLHMVDWWERRPDLRARVESEIVQFSRAWCSQGEPGVRAQWSHWQSWWHPSGVPFSDAGRLGASGGAKNIDGGRRQDLRRVRGVHVEALGLYGGALSLWMASSASRHCALWGSTTSRT